ncbi:MAG: CoB--CoM heterodisulfide reductase subunit C [Promethearchaeota archaeon]|nr:MAG: CoB--CoM heterodisulfide reductase subunit C [Candidatus Lokiarchaeota archaeon]
MSDSEQSEEQNREFKTDEDFDPEFFRNIERKSKIFSCIQCGTCTASCESGKWTALKTRNIIRKVCLGDLTVLKDPDIWLCTTCFACWERCPRNIQPTGVIMELRNYATKLGNISPNHRAVVGYLGNTGHAVPINDITKERRKELGLDELPPTLFKYKTEGEGKELENFKEFMFDLPPVKEEKKPKKKEEKK